MHFFNPILSFRSIILYTPAVDFFFTDADKAGGATKLIHIKTYVSPWEKAMKGDEKLLATLKTAMPIPAEKEDLPKYKSFNR